MVAPFVSTRTDVEPKTLVVIALEGCDPDLVRRWAGEGRLPVLSSLIERGVSGEITGADNKIDHGLFTSLWSGRSRAEHGYYHFRQVEPGTHRLREMTGRDIPIEPFWAALRGRGVRAAIIDAAECSVVDGVDGIQLCEWALHEPRHAPSANAPWVLRDAHRVYGARKVIRQHPLNTPGEDRRLLGRYLSQIERRGRLVRHFLEKDDYGLVVVGFGELHTGGHQFWSYRDQPEQYGELAHALRDIYEAIDLKIGEILQWSEGRDANVVVFGAVGLIDSYPSDVVLETVLMRLGYLTRHAAAPGARPLDLLRRCLPQSWRKALTLRFPRAAQEALICDGFATTTDWSRTTAFNIPATHASAIRINLRGREPGGVVEPGEAYEALIDRLVADIGQVTDAEDGLPLAAEVLRTRDLFGPDAHPDLPEIFINWRPSRRFFERVRHPAGEWTTEPPNWFRSSFHHDRGWYVAAGPSFEGPVTDVNLDTLDLAPMFLSLLGLDAGAQAAKRRVA